MADQHKPNYWADPDDAPKLTVKWAEGADVYKGGRLVRRGRVSGNPENKPDRAEDI
jgi:hypothetical protein